METSFGAYFGLSIVEYCFALEVWVMVLGAAGAEVVVGDDLEDVGSTQFSSSACFAEGKVVSLEPFDRTQGTGIFGDCGGIVCGVLGLRLVVEWLRPSCLDPKACR